MTKPVLIWTDIRDKAQRHDWARALPFAIHRLTWTDVFSYERMYVMCRIIPPTLPEAEAQIPLTFRPATCDDIPLLQHIYKHPSGAAAQACMIERGDLVALALHAPLGGVEEQLVGLHKASFWRESHIPLEIDAVEIARHFTLTGQDVYTHGLFVDPAYRGKRVAVPLGLYLLRTLYGLGFRRTFSTVNVRNELSLRVVRRTGGQVVGQMVALQVPGWQYVRVTPLTDKACEAED